MDPFPFAGIGGVAAVALLVAAYAVFATLVRLAGAAVSGVRFTVVPGIVDGIRDWLPGDDPGDGGTSSSAPAAVPWEELAPGQLDVE